MSTKGIASKPATNGPKARKRAIQLMRYRTERVQAAVQAVQEGQAAQAVQAGQAVQEVQERQASQLRHRTRTEAHPTATARGKSGTSYPKARSPKSSRSKDRGHAQCSAWMESVIRARRADIVTTKSCAARRQRKNANSEVVALRRTSS